MTSYCASFQSVLWSTLSHGNKTAKLCIQFLDKFLIWSAYFDNHLNFSDSAYFDNESYKVFIASTWIPLLDTNEFNGGMEVSFIFIFLDKNKKFIKKKSVSSIYKFYYIMISLASGNCFRSHEI